MRSDLPRLGKAERKYLERHAEPEAACAALLAEPGAPYAAVVVIPSYGEDRSLLDTLATVPPSSAGKPLVVLVVNQRDDCPDWACSANRKILARLRSSPANETRPRVLGPGVQHLASAGHDVVLIDRTEPGRRLPPRQGVGLARKIGADFALALWARGGVKSPWIHCTDADVALPADYFERPETGLLGDGDAASGVAPAALVYDYRHASNDPHDGSAAILQYEIFLRYYVLGLRSAGSPHSFHSIGSTLAIHTSAYAQVRGFPKREAAEDFHLLAKLAKVGRVLPLRGEPIVLSGRESKRVPFGTGHAVSLARARAQRGEPFTAYDPRNFAWLGVWLEVLKSLARKPTTPIAHLLEIHAQGTEVDPARLRRILNHLGMIEATRQALQKHGDTMRSLNECFDALGTLKLIHALRDHVHPEIPLDLALRRAAFIHVDHAFAFDPAASLEDQRTFLARLEASGS